MPRIRLTPAITQTTAPITRVTFADPNSAPVLDDATLHPRPVQQPHPPIWIGASGERRMLPLVAQHADAWHTFGNLDTLVRKSTVLDELAASAGRDPASILRAASLDLSQPIDSIRRDADERRAAGFGYLICGWPGEGRGRVEEFVDTVLPEITSN